MSGFKDELPESSCFGAPRNSFTSRLRLGQRRTLLTPRHREEQSDEAIQLFFLLLHGLLRFARNHGGRWMASLSLSSDAHTRDPLARNEVKGDLPDRLAREVPVQPSQ
jgi:hypothetical protein